MIEGPILVEGQTEERFVKDVLNPFLLPKGLSLRPTILKTKKVKNGRDFKGGVTSFDKFKKELLRLLAWRTAPVTTMLDYYGLPDTYPGMQDRPRPATARERVCHVQEAIAQNLGRPRNFIPFLALHEFEAWLFTDPGVLPRIVDQQHRQEEFESVVRQFATPEEINENPTSAPSKRIEKLFSGYKKRLHGPNAISEIGLDRIRERCPHFADWLSRLEALAART